MMKQAFLLVAIAGAALLMFQVVGSSTTQVGGADCKYQKDAQSAVTECLEEVHCGTGVCCIEEQQAMNWNRCTPDGKERKLAPVQKFYTIRNYRCLNDNCEFLNSEDSENFENDCQTEACD